MRLHSCLRAVVLVAIFIGTTSSTIGAKVGDIVLGEIVRQDEKTLILRKDPCDPNSLTVTFSAPFRIRGTGTKKRCPDQSTHELVQVEQLEAPQSKEDKTTPPKGNGKNAKKDTKPTTTKENDSGQRPPNDDK